MCELCETIKTGNLVDNVNIKKVDEHTYELQLWESDDELDYEYKMSISIPIKHCPDCGVLLGDMCIEELDFSVRIYHCLKMDGINFLSELKNKTYDDLVQIRNLGSNIKEIQEVLRRY